MKWYLIRRVLLLIPLLCGVTLLTFGLTKALPGDPALSLVGERADPAVIERMRKDLGEDSDIARQYLGYLTLLVKGELGRSYHTNRRVFDDIAMKFPNTLKLAAGAMLIAVPAGLLFGFMAARKRGTAFDRIISVCAVSGMSLPVFWSGLLLMLVFSLKWKILPPSGTGDLRYLILPALTLSLPALGMLSRITRTTVLEIMDAPFVKTAQAKGIQDRKIQLVHIFRNALIPVTTVIGLEFASYLNGAVLTETIFGWDGIGRFTMEGILKRDYPVIMGCVITGTLVFIIINLMVDILYHYLDPRVSINEQNG
jgi:peptide/nickel transport system permease protein